MRWFLFVIFLISLVLSACAPKDVFPVESSEIPIIESPTKEISSSEEKESSFDPSILNIFSEGIEYQGFETGLYPGAMFEMPDEHREDGLRIAASIQPLDNNGQLAPEDGVILAVVLGHSSTAMYFNAFSSLMEENESQINSRFRLINAAQGGKQLPEIVKLEFGVWDMAEFFIEQGGYSPLQVQVLILQTTYHPWKNVNNESPGPFPARMQSMEADLETVLKHSLEIYPNLKAAYLTTSHFRHYTGYEPHVWQEAFPIKWLIERQINNDPSTTFEGGDKKTPWLSWGPYFWDNTWDESYFSDGAHPALETTRIVAQLWWDFLLSDEVAKLWFSID